MLKHSRKRQRIDERGGTIEEYIAHLEQWVEELKRRNEYLEQQLATATAGGSVCSPPEIIDRAVASGTRPSQPRLPSAQIIIVDPTTRKANRRAKSKASIDFWAKVPKNNKEWQKRREDAKVSTLTELVDTICILTRYKPLAHPAEVKRDQSTPACILDTLRTYGSLVKELRARAIHATQMWNFSAFLFICKTILALDLGVPLQDVNRCTIETLEFQQGKCTASPTYLQRLRYDVLHWSRQANGLFLFLTCPNVHALHKISLDAGDVAGTPLVELEADILLEVPFLLKIGFPDRSFEDINNSLGTCFEAERFRARVKTLVENFKPEFENLRARYGCPAGTNRCGADEQLALELAGAAPALDSRQHQLSSLEILFQDSTQYQEEAQPNNETIVGAFLQPTEFTDVEEFDSSWFSGAMFDTFLS